MYVRTSVAGSPGARCGVPVDLDVTMGGSTVWSRVRSKAEQQVHDRLNRARSRLATTELHLCQPRQVQTSGEQQSGDSWAATAMRIQAYCPLAEPPVPGNQQRRSRWGSYHQCQTNFMQWRLPPGGNRTPFNEVTVRPLPANTLGLQTMEQS